MTSKPSPHKNFLHSIQSNLEAYVVLSAEPLSPPSDSEVSRFLSLDPGSEDFEHFLCDSGFMNFIAGMEMLSPAKSELPLLESDVLTVRFTPSFCPKRRFSTGFKVSRTVMFVYFMGIHFIYIPIYRKI